MTKGPSADELMRAADVEGDEHDEQNDPEVPAQPEPETGHAVTADALLEQLRRAGVSPATRRAVERELRDQPAEPEADLAREPEAELARELDLDFDDRGGWVGFPW